MTGKLHLHRCTNVIVNVNITKSFYIFIESNQVLRAGIAEEFYNPY